MMKHRYEKTNCAKVREWKGFKRDKLDFFLHLLREVSAAVAFEFSGRKGHTVHRKYFFAG